MKNDTTNECAAATPTPRSSTVPQSYLCIGGPMHGLVRTIPGRSYQVPTTGADWVGTEQTYDPTSTYRLRVTTYEVRQLEWDARHEQPNVRGGVTISVTVRASVRVLVHESILTGEEAAAQYRKLRPNDMKDAADIVLSRQPFFAK